MSNNDPFIRGAFLQNNGSETKACDVLIIN